MDLPLAVGPLLPAEKDLVLLVGDGYIAGYFLASLFLTDAVEILSEQASREGLRELELKTERARRWGGVAAACMLSVVWVIGHLTDSSSYPLAPSDHDLFGAIPMFSIGVMAAVLCAPYAVRKVEDGNRTLAEYLYSEAKGRLWGLVLAAVYLGFWINS